MPYRREKGKRGSKSPKKGAIGGDGSIDGLSEEEGDSASAEPEGIAKILCKLASMDASFNELKSDVKEGFQSTDFLVNQLKEKVDKTEVDSRGNRVKVEELTSVTAGLKARSEVHGTRLADIEHKIELIERERRRNILIIEGVVEEEGISSPEIVEQLFQDLKLEFDSLVCDRIYRRGKTTQGTGDGLEVAGANTNKRAPKKSRPRPIVVGFKLIEEKIEVFKHLKNLRGNERWSRVYISDDLTECQQRQMRDLRALSAYAKSKGFDSSIRANCLVIDRRKYAYKDLFRLAPELKLEKAKTLECLDGKGIAFQSVHSPLSNLYPCNIVYQGRVFLSAEGALQFTRATICKREDVARAIEFERDAYEAKRAAADIKFSQEWQDVVVEVLEEILIIKFTTNENCRKALLATGNRMLFEATGDKTWSCGLPLAKIHELALPPPGKNRTGTALEKVRGIIKSE